MKNSSAYFSTSLSKTLCAYIFQNWFYREAEGWEAVIGLRLGTDGDGQIPCSFTSLLSDSKICVCVSICM